MKEVEETERDGERALVDIISATLVQAVTRTECGQGAEGAGEPEIRVVPISQPIYVFCARWLAHRPIADKLRPRRACQVPAVRPRKPFPGCLGGAIELRRVCFSPSAHV